MRLRVEVVDQPVESVWINLSNCCGQDVRVRPTRFDTLIRYAGVLRVGHDGGRLGQQSTRQRGTVPSWRCRASTAAAGELAPPARHESR